MNIPGKQGRNGNVREYNSLRSKTSTQKPLEGHSFAEYMKILSFRDGYVKNAISRVFYPPYPCPHG